jgi:hypothetical protein
MNFMRFFARRKNRNVTLSILGLAIGATAWTMAARRRKKDQSGFMGRVIRLFR